MTILEEEEVELPSAPVEEQKSPQVGAAAGSWELAEQGGERQVEQTEHRQ